jgi:hypothetical protein
MMLPANQPAQHAEIGIVNIQVPSVARAMDQPLDIGRNQFAMAANQLSPSIEEQHAVVHCRAAGSVG